MGGKKATGEKTGWRFFWKNVNGLGMLLRLGAGAALIAAARSVEDKKKSNLMTGMGAEFVVAGVLRWCPLRAVLRRPTKRAYLKHYPGAAD